MKDILERKVAVAKVALKEWNALIHFSKPEPNDYILLFPSSNYEYNYYGLRYIDTFLQRVNGHQVIILTEDNYVKENASKLSGNVKSVIHCDKEQAKRLITLYELFGFDDRFMVISLDEPWCRNAAGLVGAKGTTVEQLIAIGVYSIIPFRPIQEGERVI